MPLRFPDRATWFHCDLRAALGKARHVPVCPSDQGPKLPSGPDWFHEIKHDGYQVIRQDRRVRLETMGGYDYTKRYPWIVECALKIGLKQFVLDGEAVVLGVDGKSNFDDLQSRKHDEEVQFYAFDILAGDGEDYRNLPLSVRKTKLARLLAHRPEGIFAADYEQGEIGPDLFVAACNMGLEGMVAKHRERPYREGPFKYWVKVKNPKHPAYRRVQDQFRFGGRRSSRSTAYDRNPRDVLSG